MLKQETIAQFRAQLRGELIEPSDPSYATARKVYNAMIDKKPALIARCADVADVITAVRFGGESGLRVAIRGGGHNAAGLGVSDNALVIDLSPIRYVHVDAAARTVRVGGQSMFDGLYTPGLQWYWKADFVKELGDRAIDLHVKHGAQLPSLHSTMYLYPINGAAHKHSNSDTPWTYRDASWTEVIVGVDPDPANRDRIVNWARDYWQALHPFGAGGAYVNFMMEEGTERIRATYGENYDRLATIKAKYDPTNFFNVNQNIQPAASRASST